ncbi:hypothetical protein [Streptomyces cadmiisoli]|uniref:hypothetical protein n=1 Tax=Streptomyces cadmiisoli TaxID=2184053 RepID=UPI0036641E93
MLRLDLAQVPRLVEIEANTRERLDEAHRMQWLGEVAALKGSLRHINDKKKQADRFRGRPRTERADPASSAEQSH